MFGFGKNKKSENITVTEMPSMLPENIKGAGGFEVEDAVAPAALEIESNYVKLGEKVARTLFVFTYPRYLAISWFAPVINLDKVFDISIFIHPQDTNTVLRQLQKKVADVQSQIHMREEKGLVRDPKLDTAYQDIEVLRDQLQQAQERLFDVGLYVTIYGESEDELERNEKEIKSLLESRLIYLKPALFQQEEAYKSVLPVAEDKISVHTKLNSQPLSSLFPFTSFDLTSDRGILYGINRQNASLVLFDRFSLENYNLVIFAKAGSGKSFLSKLEILRSLIFDTDVIVIDPEREYEFLPEAVGGR